MTYFPKLPPSDKERLSEYVQTELRDLALDLARPKPTLKLVESHEVPTRPEAGDICFADGADWNPGSGAGIYYFDGSSWTKL